MVNEEEPLLAQQLAEQPAQEELSPPGMPPQPVEAQDVSEEEEEVHSICSWRWWEAESCCACCDVQLGAKVISIVGVVQGLTNCMSVGTAGFLAAPILLIGVLGVTFGLYGFWGAQKYDEQKINAHFRWLLAAVVLLVGVSVGRIYTSQDFCTANNCVLDHMYYGEYGGYNGLPHQMGTAPLPASSVGPASQGATAMAQAAGATTAHPSATVEEIEVRPKVNAVVSEMMPPKESMPPKGRHLLRVASVGMPPHSRGVNTPKVGIPVYREPCYVSHMRPSIPVCVEAHEMSAWTTIVVTIPLNLYFAYVIRSLYNKVQRGDLPPPQVNRPIGRPISVARGAPPPLTVYEAQSLDGTPVSGHYTASKELQQRLQDAEEAHVRRHTLPRDEAPGHQEG